MDSLSPVKDIGETINFYKIIGFKVAMTVPEEGDFVWMMMTFAENEE